MCAWLLFVGACSDQSFELSHETVPGSPSGPRISHDPPPGTAGRMTHHFADALEIQRAVIAGDLAGVPSPARRLAERTDPYPESWRPFMARNEQLARSAQTASSLADAAHAAAALANNCGECHAAVGFGPHRSTSPPQPDTSDASGHMLRHQWAAERMWDALISHDETMWFAGAEVLSAAPLRPPSLPTDVTLPKTLVELAEQVHDLGARARASGSWADRESLHGELLSTCAGCHRGLLLGRLPFLARDSPHRERGGR